ncbi:MAG: lipid-A-disaccharide synthase [Gammaproteobacteria bacterium]|nr:lipid-A-disaccharide synthase [Gammaproteobacteria bacterium]
MRIGIVAGEASGDLLGAGLISAIRQRYPDAVFEGIAGPQMMAAGASSLFPMERLSVMGFSEVFGRLRELLGIRRQLAEHFISNPPDVFIGIDAPDFTLGLERRLHKAGIKTVHYVSPSVWAWRQRRVKKIVKSTDLMLTLFPFEAKFYRDHRMPVHFVGHPLADLIPMHPDQAAARCTLGLPAKGEVLALLPGSRSTELKHLAATFIDTARWLKLQRPKLHVVVPLANEQRRRQFQSILAKALEPPALTLIDGRAREVMTAADVVLLASGTASLEAMLLKRPMVVAYRMAPFSYWLAKRLLKVKSISLPNLLANDILVPELLQDEATPDQLGLAVLYYFENPQSAAEVMVHFDEIHHELRQDASQQAALAVLELIGR